MQSKARNRLIEEDSAVCEDFIAINNMPARHKKNLLSNMVKENVSNKQLKSIFKIISFYIITINFMFTFCKISMC